MNPLGKNLDEYWDGLIEGRSTARTVEGIDPSDKLAINVACANKGVDPAAYVDRKASAHATGDAAGIIAHGDADVMLAGGTEAGLCEIGIYAFGVIKALSTRNDAPEKASRPFDRDRDGFVAGEGAGVLVLESLQHAVNRGARVYGEVLGFGLTCDAFHHVAPDSTG